MAFPPVAWRARIARRLIDETNGESSNDAVENIFFDRILSWAPNVYRPRRDDFFHRGQAKESMMKRTLIRYKTKPESADENAGLIAGVFEELKAAKPAGVRYLSLRLDDDSFVHFVETEADDGASAIPKLAAFQAFQSGIRERCAELPVARGVTIVGNYRMLGEP